MHTEEKHRLGTAGIPLTGIRCFLLQYSAYRRIRSFLMDINDNGKALMLLRVRLKKRSGGNTYVSKQTNGIAMNGTTTS